MELLSLTIKQDLNVRPESLLPTAQKFYDVVVDAQMRFPELGESDVHIWVEQGSLIRKTKLYLPLIITLDVISRFDGVVGGIEKMVHYSDKIMNYVTQDVVEAHNPKVTSIKRSNGAPGQIRRILRQVQQGELTIEEGTQKVLILLEREEAEAKIKEEFLRKFIDTAQVLYSNPLKQLEMFPDDEFVVPVDSTPSKRSSPAQPAKPPLQGVEVWYDRKTGRKQVRAYTK